MPAKLIFSVTVSCINHLNCKETFKQLPEKNELKFSTFMLNFNEVVQNFRPLDRGYIYNKFQNPTLTCYWGQNHPVMVIGRGLAELFSYGVLLRNKIIQTCTLRKHVAHNCGASAGNKKNK